MRTDREATLQQALVAVLSLNEDSGLSLDGIVSDVNTALGENGKYRHYCPDTAEAVCEVVEGAVEEVKAKRAQKSEDN